MLNFYYKSGIEFLTGAPLACRTSPACSTPSTRWWMPPSTILPAAARRCESSCPWLPTAASGGGAVRRVRQVKPPVHTAGDSSAEKRAFCVPPACSAGCQLTRWRLLSCRKGVRFRPSKLCSSQSQHRSISPTQ